MKKKNLRTAGIVLLLILFFGLGILSIFVTSKHEDRKTKTGEQQRSIRVWF